MKKDIDIKDFSKRELFELLLYMNNKINDIQNDSVIQKDLLEKVIQQNNSLVKFLASVEIENIYEGNESYDTYIPAESESYEDFNKKTLIEMAESLLERKKDLKDLEEELKKHKDKLTPGQVGEA
tara:strand:+ start:1049 stop:1423 length:375 start_codon:yes stop_codon:yes gene_type:complete